MLTNRALVKYDWLTNQSNKENLIKKIKIHVLGRKELSSYTKSRKQHRFEKHNKNQTQKNPIYKAQSNTTDSLISIINTNYPPIIKVINLARQNIKKRIIK